MCSRHAGVNDTVNLFLCGLPGNRVGRPTRLRVVASATMTSFLSSFGMIGALNIGDSFGLRGALLSFDSFVEHGSLTLSDSLT